MLASIRIRNSKQLSEDQRRARQSVNGAFLGCSERYQQATAPEIQSIHHRQEGHMSQAQRVEANRVGSQATEAHQDQRLHMLAEQRDFLQAADRNSEVERTRWSTVLRYQKVWFHQAP